ncbi:unnamed protein product [Lactuca saligna]|uniref:Elongation factor EFG domain-containing protein n=1 Tax=Lactuca saligna TaxID=75948 RepID=A0AA35Y890_LACSI|nr:unnamed protein product [Lactuca saligna]
MREGLNDCRMAAVLDPNFMVNLRSAKRITIEVAEGLQKAQKVSNYLRREHFELSVSPPRVMYKIEKGVKLEPIEEVNEEHVGMVMEALSHRRAEVTDMGPVAGNFGVTRMTLTCPSRGLVGYRSVFSSDTRGTRFMHRAFMAYEKYCGPLGNVRKGVLVNVTCYYSFGQKGKDSVKWAAEMSVGLGASVPRARWKETDALEYIHQQTYKHMTRMNKSPDEKLNIVSDVAFSPVDSHEQKSTDNITMTDKDHLPSSLILDEDQLSPPGRVETPVMEETSVDLPAVPSYVELTEKQQTDARKMTIKRIIDSYKQLRRVKLVQTHTTLLS